MIAPVDARHHCSVRRDRKDPLKDLTQRLRLTGPLGRRNVKVSYLRLVGGSSAAHVQPMPCAGAERQSANGGNNTPAHVDIRKIPGAKDLRNRIVSSAIQGADRQSTKRGVVASALDVESAVVDKLCDGTRNLDVWMLLAMGARGCDDVLTEIIVSILDACPLAREGVRRSLV